MDSGLGLIRGLYVRPSWAAIENQGTLNKNLNEHSSNSPGSHGPSGLSGMRECDEPDHPIHHRITVRTCPVRPEKSWGNKDLAVHRSCRNPRFPTTSLGHAHATTSYIRTAACSGSCLARLLGLVGNQMCDRPKLDGMRIRIRIQETEVSPYVRVPRIRVVRTV